MKRYASYTATLVTKDAYENARKGEPAKRHQASFTFRTGSDLYEPTHYRLSLSNVFPRTTKGTALTVYAEDDYGNPARGATLSVGLTEHGAVARTGSAAATHAQTVMLADEAGKVHISISDTEAEDLTVSVTASGSYPEGDWTGAAEITRGPATTGTGGTSGPTRARHRSGLTRCMHSTIMSAIRGKGSK